MLHTCLPRSVKDNSTFEHNFRQNAVVLRLKLKSIMLKFSSTALPPAVQLYVAIKHKINDLGEDCT